MSLMSEEKEIAGNEFDSDILIIVIAIGTLVIASFFLIVYCCCCRRKEKQGRRRSGGNIFSICKTKLCRQTTKDTESATIAKKNCSTDDVTRNDVEMFEMYAGLNTKRPSALPNNYEALQKMSVQYEQIDSPLVFKFKVTDNTFFHNNPDSCGTHQKFADVKEESEDEDHYQPSSGPFRLRSATELSAKFESSSTAAAADKVSQKRLRASTELSVISTSFGSSQNLFRKISDVVKPVISTPRFESVANDDDDDDDSEDQTQFATYVQLESSEGIYKQPSSVPKFEAPKDVPHCIQRDSYVAMDNSKYDVMTAPVTGPVMAEDDIERKFQGEEGGNGEVVGGGNGYAPLSFDVDSDVEDESECYEQLQFED